MRILVSTNRNTNPNPIFLFCGGILSGGYCSRGYYPGGILSGQFIPGDIVLLPTLLLGSQSRSSTDSKRYSWTNMLEVGRSSQPRTFRIRPKKCCNNRKYV